MFKYFLKIHIINEHWAESYHCKGFYKESAKTCHELISYIPLRQHQSHEQLHGMLQLSLASILQPSSAGRWCLLSTRRAGWLHGDASAINLVAKGNFTPLQQDLLSLTFLLPASLAPSVNCLNLLLHGPALSEHG